MKRTSAAKVVVFLALFFAVHIARSAIVVIEPDALPVGTDVSNLFPGISINQLVWGDGTVDFRPVGTGEFVDAPTGNAGFGWFALADGGSTEAILWKRYLTGELSFVPSHLWGTSGPLVIQFDEPVSFFEIAYMWPYSDTALLFAFDVHGDSVGSCEGLSVTCSGQASHTIWEWNHPSYGNTGTLQVGDPGYPFDPFISSVLLGGWTTPVFYDRIRYRSVPESSSFLLFALGVIFIGIMRVRFP